MHFVSCEIILIYSLYILQNFLSYEKDLNNSAPPGGKELAKNFDVFKGDFSASVVVHCKFKSLSDMTHHRTSPCRLTNLLCETESNGKLLVQGNGPARRGPPRGFSEHLHGGS